MITACGVAGPSSKNAQPWRFHVVTDTSLLSVVVEGIVNSDGVPTYVPVDPNSGLVPAGWESTVLESAAVLKSAAAAIFVENLGHFSGSRTALAHTPPGRLEGRLVAYTLECTGIGAAVQNMWLAALALGLKAAFMGDVGVEEGLVQRVLGMSGDLVGVLVVGYSSAPPEPKRSVTDDVDRVVWHRPCSG